METPNKEWLESARQYIRFTEECDCDCLLCQQDDHFENHCGIDDEEKEKED